VPDQIKLLVPDLGDFSDVEVIEILVAPGDTVEVEDGLVTLETDKASMDVPASHAGTVVSVDVAVGDRVSTGSAVVTIEAAEAADSPAASDGATSEQPDEEPGEDWSVRTQRMSPEEIEEATRHFAARTWGST
jgi:pyruvate dehydrogenase E2 component (dihydrolipoamide acetyltransferase)